MSRRTVTLLVALTLILLIHALPATALGKKQSPESLKDFPTRGRIVALEAASVTLQTEQMGRKKEVRYECAPNFKLPGQLKVGELVALKTDAKGGKVVQVKVLPAKKTSADPSAAQPPSTTGVEPGEQRP